MIGTGCKKLSQIIRERISAFVCLNERVLYKVDDSI